MAILLITSVAITQGQELTWEAACQRAASEHKFVAVEFFSYKSVESKILRDGILSQPVVKQMLSEKFVFASFELEQNRELASKYAIHQTPTILLVKTDGTEIDRMGRRATADQFIEFLRAGAESRATLSQLQVKAQISSSSLEDHIALADAYAQRQQGREALREYFWCLEQGQEKDARGYRKNAPIIMRRVAALGIDLPAAKDALRELREKTEKQMQSQPSLDGYNLIFNCNYALNESASNLEAYLTLPEKHPLRAQLFSSIFVQLVEQRRYSDACTIVDLETFVGQAYPLSRQSATEVLNDGTDWIKSKLAAHRATVGPHNRMVAERTTPAVEALLATSQFEKARRLAGRALEFDQSRLLRLRLLEAVRRSGTTEAHSFETWLKTYSLPADSNDQASATPAGTH